MSSPITWQKIRSLREMVRLMPGFRFRHNDRTIRKLFARNKRALDIVYADVGNRTVRSIIVTGNPENTWLACIHGAPGSCMDFFPYLSDKRLSKKYNMISLDRPGYGYSGLGLAEPSIDAQAEMIFRLLCDLGISDRITFLAHSYGGPIAARIAMNHPQAVSQLWMLAPAIDPDKEKRFRIAHLALRKPFSAFVPHALQVAAREKLVHADQLKVIRSGWNSITARVVHMHGTSDRIVPFENLDFSERVLHQHRLTGVELKGSNHFFVWTQSEMVIQALLHGVVHAAAQRSD